MLPLGTGNDLSREFGWGMGYEPKEKEMADIVKHLKAAKPRPLDIWQVKITPWNPATKEVQADKTRTEIMFNYFNMGFDSQAALGFHTLVPPPLPELCDYRSRGPAQRESGAVQGALHEQGIVRASTRVSPWSHAVRSYGLYALESWVQGTPLLSECIELRLDGKAAALPEDLKTLVFLNFTCYQGGMDVWGPLKDKDGVVPRMDDGRVEVVGLGGLWHEMKARTEVSHGFRIGQAAKAEIRVTKPVQIAMAHDGEPFAQDPAIIEVERWGTVDILVHPEHEAREEKKRLKAEKKRLKADAAKSKSPSPARAASPRAEPQSASPAVTPAAAPPSSPPVARP